MRIAHLADLHLTERPCRSDVPLEEQEEILGRIAMAINEAQVDAVLIAGDCYDGTSTPRERRTMRDFLRSLKCYCKVICDGNHDAAMDLAMLSQNPEGTHIVSVPCAMTPLFKGVELAIAPWPRVRNAEGYAAIVRGLRARCGHGERSGLKPVLLAHCDMIGAELDGGQDTTGKVDATISADDLAEMGWTYCALGHYHKRQLHPWGGYAGGIRPMKFGDDSRKGVVIVDLGSGKREEIDCAGYSLITIEGDMACGTADVAGQHLGARDRLRLRYKVSEEDQATAFQRASSVASALAPHVRSIVIEPEVIPTVRVRAPEIAAAKTDEDVLRAYLATTGATRVEEIVEKSEAVK